MKKSSILMSFLCFNLLVPNSWGENVSKIEAFNQKPSLNVKQSLEIAQKYWASCIKEKQTTINLETIQVFWEPLKENEYGATDYSMKDNQIILATISVNKNKEITQENLDYIITHEIGHILQVKHNLRENSVMYYKPIKVMTLETKNKELDNRFCIQDDTD